MHALTIYAALCLAVGPPELAEPGGRSPAELEAATEQLGSGKYELRQQATEQLWSAGEAAIPALQQATRSKNPEVRARAAYVLENLQQGITFDTPREILREVQRFRQGAVEDKRLALTMLETAQRPRIVWGLIQSERDQRWQEEWLPSLERALRATLLGGNEREVEATLRDAAVNDPWIRHWVAYLASRGGIEDEVLRLHQLPDSAIKNPELHARQLAYLLRAKGDLGEAQRFAELAEKIRADEELLRQKMAPATRLAVVQASFLESKNSDDLAWQLILERHDWSTAAQRMKERIERNPQQEGTDPESLGFAAAYHRLATQPEGAEPFLKKLRTIADETARTLPELDPRRRDTEKNLIDKQWQVGKALLLNGKHAEAVEVLRQHHAAFAFEFLVFQQQYREAFAVAGVPYPHGFNREWFEKMAADTASADDAARNQFAIGLHALRQLYFLGERELVRHGLTALQKATEADSGTSRRRMLCDTAVKLGQRELATAVGAAVLEREGSPSLLAVLYPNRHSLATVWWEFFREQAGQETIVQSLARIDRCLLFRGPKMPSAELQGLVTEAEKRLVQLVEPKRAEWWHALGETCLLHGEKRLGMQLLAEAAALSSADAIKLGDLHAADQQWNEAADWYGRASEFDKFQPLPRYLQGQAWVRGGRQQEGEPLVRSALQLPLGNDEMRKELAAGIKERGYREESLRQFELLQRTGEPGEQNVIEAAKQIGNAIYQQEPLRGAACWEEMVLCCLRSRWGFADANGYVQIPFLVHKTRAKGLLEAGRADQGIQELWAGHAVAPMNLELPEELIPVLQKASRTAEADRLLETVYQDLRQACVDFPKCATLHNNVAWLLARNARRLDEALQHVQQALVLEPANPAYLDTLGEVHFRRGEVGEAIACAERCLKLDPQSKHYQEQLARFRAARKDG